jgi:hypothetical protein
MSFCPDKPILAGFLGSFALYPLSALAGRHDGDLICLTQRAVNNPNPAMKAERIVSKNLGFYKLVCHEAF